MTHGRRRLASLLALASFAGSALGQSTWRASIAPGGVQGTHDSFTGSDVSDDGTIVVFASWAKNWVAGDKPGTFDVFVRDTVNDTLDCISLSTGGLPGTGDSLDPHISGDGRFVLFISDSPSLVAGDNNGWYDVFLFDRQTSTTTRVDVDNNGNEANFGAAEPRFSADGRYALFSTGSTNLDPGDTNNFNDVYLRDLQLGTTERISIATSGVEGHKDSFSGGVSDDGNLVVFASYANNLDPADANGGGDIFLRDRAAGTTTLISLDSNGNSANGDCFYSTISGDGRIVAFGSYASNLVANDTNHNDDVFVRDLATGETTCASVDSNGALGLGVCSPATLTQDGRYVVFASIADLTPNPSIFVQPTVFLRDRTLGITLTPAEDSAGTPSKGESSDPSASSDGRFISFWCSKNDLVSGDTNGRDDVFVHEFCVTPAAWANFGAGLAGTNGVPSLTATAPLLHSDGTVTIGDSTGLGTFGVLFVGDNSGTVPTTLGADILLLPTSYVGLTLPAGGLTLVESIPEDEYLCGFTTSAQVLELDPGAVKGVSFTPRLDLTFGR